MDQLSKTYLQLAIAYRRSGQIREAIGVFRTFKLRRAEEIEIAKRCT